MADIDKILDNSELSHADLLSAFDLHKKRAERFKKLLGPEASASKIMGYMKKYGPLVSKYFAAGAGGAGILEAVRSFFPNVLSSIGLG